MMQEWHSTDYNKKSFTSADWPERRFTKKFEALLKEQSSLEYADAKLDFACMHLAGSEHLLSLCVYYDLCG